MKLVIAAGIFPPEVGGPAQYAFNLSEEFRKMGHGVVVVRYGSLKQFPSGLRHALYGLKLFVRALSADAIFAFDTYSVGVPAAFVARVLRKPLVIRIGGDFLWEQYTNRTKELIPLPLFYGKAQDWNRKERAIYSMTRSALRDARLAFNTQWLADIWEKEYALSPDSIHIVENAYQPCIATIAPTAQNFLFYSRQVTLKNHASFRKAFEAVKQMHPTITLEEGMVSHEELQEKMRTCYAVVVPSITDVAPNYVLDAIRNGKPFLLTKYSGYAAPYGSMGVIVDPLDAHDMERGVRTLLDPTAYAAFVERIRAFQGRHSFADIAKELIALAKI